MKRYYALKGIKIGIFFIAMVALGGFVVMSLWNWLIPDIFGLTTITWMQAFGLLALSRILFGSWGDGKGGRYRGKGKMQKRWKQRWEEKMKEMTPEQRARMKEKFGHKGRSCSDWMGEEDQPESPKADLGQAEDVEKE